MRTFTCRSIFLYAAMLSCFHRKPFCHTKLTENESYIHSHPPPPFPTHSIWFLCEYECLHDNASISGSSCYEQDFLIPSIPIFNEKTNLFNPLQPPPHPPTPSTEVTEPILIVYRVGGWVGGELFPPINNRVTEYTATLLVRVNVVKGGGRAPPTLTSQFQFYPHH